MTLSSIFKNRAGIETEIDSFLNMASESGIIFTEGMNAYLAGDLDSFEANLIHIIETEKKADRLRRSIEDLLYRKTLVPESRGDVLELIERMDIVLGQFKGVMYRIEIERPDVSVTFHADLKNMCGFAVKTVEAITLSIRAYFKNISQVESHMHKVSFWETESDKVSTRLQKAIFSSEEMPLDQKMQLRDLVKHIDGIADKAEDTADSLAIYVIKRSL